MEETVKRFHPDSERASAEGCLIVELPNDPDDPDVSIARARVPSGVTTKWQWSFTRALTAVRRQDNFPFGGSP
jgi:hypothetical protein